MESNIQPKYKRLQDISSFYIKDGKLIKNRGNMLTTIDNEIKNYNNIIIETDEMVEIYCDKEKATIYEKAIENLKLFFKDPEEGIRIHCNKETLKIHYYLYQINRKVYNYKIELGESTEYLVHTKKFFGDEFQNVCREALNKANESNGELTIENVLISEYGFSEVRNGVWDSFSYKD